MQTLKGRNLLCNKQEQHSKFGSYYNQNGWWQYHPSHFATKKAEVAHINASTSINNQRFIINCYGPTFNDRSYTWRKNIIITSPLSYTKNYVTQTIEIHNIDLNTMVLILMYTLTKVYLPTFFMTGHRNQPDH